MNRPRPDRPASSPAGRISPGEVRIIGGDLRGRKFSFPAGGPTRPMKDRVREAVFNLLGVSIRGGWVLDLFAGTGALGLEALSRGAARALFLERHIPTAQSLRTNIAALGLGERAQVQATDTFFWASRFQPEQTTPWVVFCSPPYDLYVERQEELLGMLGRLIELAPPRSQWVVESDNRFDPALLPKTIAWDVRSYPPTVVAIGEKQALLTATSPPSE